MSLVRDHLSFSHTELYTLHTGTQVDFWFQKGFKLEILSGQLRYGDTALQTIFKKCVEISIYEGETDLSGPDCEPSRLSCL